MPPSEPPLAGTTVLDFTIARAGPTAVRLLADWGANVIRIEARPQDSERAMSGRRHGSDEQNLHRNKRSLCLDLKSPRGREVLDRLVRRSDVVVENFRADVKERLGLGYERLRAINPRVVLASISGFGQDGPYADRPGRRPDRAGPERPDVDHRRARPRADACGHRGVRHRGRHVPRSGHPAGAAATRAHRRRPMGAHVAARGDAQQARLPGRALHDERRGARPGRQPPPHPGADGHLPRAATAWSTSPPARKRCGTRCARRSTRHHLAAQPEFASTDAAQPQPPSARRTPSTPSRSASAPPSWCSGSIRWACRAGRSTTSARRSKTRRCSTCA